MGSGSYGQVYKAVNKMDKNHVVAIKVIEKKEMTENEDLCISLFLTKFAQ